MLKSDRDISSWLVECNASKRLSKQRRKQTVKKEIAYPANEKKKKKMETEVVKFLKTISYMRSE